MKKDAPMATSTGLAMSWDEWQRRDASALAPGGSGTMRNE
jgi:hypothetical protein